MVEESKGNLNDSERHWICSECKTCQVRIENSKCTSCDVILHSGEHGVVPPTGHSLSVIQCSQFGYLLDLCDLAKSGSIDVNARDEVNATALHWACLNNHLHIVNYLLTYEEVDINAIGGDLQSTPIYWAVRRNRLYLVPYLLEKGADPMIPDINGVNAFFLSVQCEQVALTAYLVAHSENNEGNAETSSIINSVCGTNTGLMWISRYRHNLSMLRTLINLRADINFMDDAGNTALHYAAMNVKYTIVRELLSCNPDINLRNSEGKTAHDIAQEILNQDPKSPHSKAVYKLFSNASSKEMLSKKWPNKVFQKHYQKVLACIPFFYLPLTMLIVSVCTIECLVFVQGLLTLGCWVLASWTGVCISLDRTAISPLMLSINVSSTFWLSSISFVMFTPIIPWTVFVLQWISIGMLVYHLYYCKETDAGTLSTTYNEKLSNIHSMVQNPTAKDISICPTCLVQQPLRSKHVGPIGSCVAKFDHYCPFVFNAIGAYNHRHFLLFLVGAVAAISLFLYSSFKYFSLNGIWKENPTVLSSLWAIFHYYPITGWFSCLALFHLWWVTGLLMFQTYLLTQGKTTNEFLLKTAYGNSTQHPFNRGPWLNVFDMFNISISRALPSTIRSMWWWCYPLSIDWKKIMSLEDYAYLQSIARTQRRNGIAISPSRRSATSEVI